MASVTATSTTNMASITVTTTNMASVTVTTTTNHGFSNSNSTNKPRASAASGLEAEPVKLSWVFDLPCSSETSMFYF